MNMPDGWQKLPLNRMIRLRSGDFISNDDIDSDGPYPVYGGNGFRGFTDNFNTIGPIVLVGRQGAHCGNVHIANDEIWVSEHALRCFPQKVLDARWLAFALQELDLNQYSVSAAQPGLSVDNLKFLRTSFPPLETQRRIAQFLEEKTARIDSLIEKKRTLLDLLAEKRQALITRAVTKGLDPTAPLKPSGIDWLGDIPAHWEVLPLKRRIISIEQGWSPAAEERTAAQDEWGVLKSGCVNEGVYNENSHKALPSFLDPRTSLEVKAGDILMCRASGSLKYIGSAALVRETRPRLMFSDKTYRITADVLHVDQSFLVYSMASKHMREQILLSVSGAEGLANNIAQASVGRYFHSFPPLDEQIEIANYLDNFLGEIEAARSIVTATIRKLYEYRAALITCAVTGQLAELQ